MEIFIRTGTASVELFFNIFTSEIETFVTPQDQRFNPVSQKFAAWDWNHCCDTHLRLSVILKTLTLTGQEFLEVLETMEITGREVRAIGWMMMKTPPCRTTAENVFTIQPYVIIDLAQLTMNFDRRYALCIQKLYHRYTSQPVGAGIRTSIFNRCNDYTVITREVPVVHASSDVILYHVQAVTSRNKLFNTWGEWETYLVDVPLRTYNNNIIKLHPHETVPAIVPKDHCSNCITSGPSI